jgi:3-oxoacyl-[acyl-carrier-protein] synthase-1
VDPSLLEAFADLGLLMTPEFPAGFIPGEAAAFVLLRAPGGPQNPLAWIEGAAQGAEAAHRLSEVPVVADSLTETVGLVLDGGSSAAEPVLALSSVNGSPWTSNEWGYLLTRARGLADAEAWFPVGDVGEVGAALGPVGACLAIRGFSRGYAGAGRSLLVLSSESGRKGAVLLRAPSDGGRNR